MKVLLAIDGTEESDEAVNVLKSLNLPEVTELQILTVVDMALPFAHDIYSGMVTNTAEIEKAAVEAAEESLGNTKERVERMFAEDEQRVFVNTLIGSPEKQIVEEAETFGADLIVVGSHGYNTWERLLLGSVSDSVVHHAPCSVLVVRHKAESA